MSKIDNLKTKSWSSLSHDLQLLTKGIQQGCSFEGIDSAGRTLLHVIVETGMTSLLSAVFEQAQAQNMEIAELPLDALDYRGWTPLHLACFLGYWDMGLQLLSLGANPNIPSNCASNLPLHFLVAHSCLPQQKPINLPVSVLTFTPRFSFPLRPTSAANLPFFYQLLRTIMAVSGPSFLNFQNDLGETPLFIAAKLGREQAAQLLLQHNADVSIENHLGDSPLSMAVCVGKISLVALLLSYHPLEWATALCLAEELQRQDLVAIIRSLEPLEPYIPPLKLNQRYLVGELTEFENMHSLPSDLQVMEACFSYELEAFFPLQSAEANTQSLPVVTRLETKKSRHAKSRSISIASRFFGHSEEQAQPHSPSPLSLQDEKNAKSRYCLRRSYQPPSASPAPLFRIGYDESSNTPVFIMTFNSLQHRLQSSDLLKLQLQHLLRQQCISSPTRISSTTQLHGRDIHQHLLQWHEIIQGEDKHQLFIITEYIDTLQPMDSYLNGFQVAGSTYSSNASPRRTAQPSAFIAQPLAIPEGISALFASQLFSLLLHLHRLVQLIPQLHSQWTLYFRPDDMYVHLVKKPEGPPEIRLKLGLIGLSPLSFSLKHESRSLVEQRALTSSWFRNWCADTELRHLSSVLLMPPEQIDRTRASFLFGETISVWFLGVFLFQLLSGGRLPFFLSSDHHLELDEIFLRIATYSPTGFNFSNIPEKFHVDLIAMLQPNPFERICLEDLCRSPVWTPNPSSTPVRQSSDPMKSGPPESEPPRNPRKGSYRRDKNPKSSSKSSKKS